MKKLTLITFVAIFFVACNDSKSKEGDNKTSNSTESVKPSATGDDAALTAWLSGKMLTSTYDEPKYDMWDKFKFNADGTGTDKDNSTAKWEIKDGQFIFHGPMDMKYKIEKKNDSTMLMKGSIKDNNYKVSPIK